MNRHLQKYSVSQSRRRREPLPIVAIIAAFSFLLTQLSFARAASVELGVKRKTELIHLLKQDCGSCHGMTLKGSLGPALLPYRMAKRDAGQLRAIILDGVPDTPMPPWRELLSSADVTYLVKLLQEGVPHD
ncbi:MAG TPA: cytochrome c [Gammaproteobacteria bacterium]|nr:cytochrome c [Gammaproteobacteria bacterium]